jgi:hypothetical protein
MEVSSFLMVTLASEMTAPDTSVTVPVMPALACAHAPRAAKSTKHNVKSWIAERMERRGLPRCWDMGVTTAS